MRGFGPFTAEGGLVLALAAVIAGGTFVVDSYAPDTKPQTRTVYGTPTIRVHDVGAGGIQPGEVQPRAAIPVVAAPIGTVVGAPAVTPVPTPTPTPKKKRGKQVATPAPTVPADAVVEDAGTTSGTIPNKPGGGTCALLVLCPPGGSAGGSAGADDEATASEQDPQAPEIGDEPTKAPTPAKTAKPKTAQPKAAAKPAAPPAE